MHIITEDVFLKHGLQAFIKHKEIMVDNSDIILDFDNNFIILTTSSTLKEIIKNDHDFESFLLHPFLKIKKSAKLAEIFHILKYKSWHTEKYNENRLPLTKKERMLLSHIITKNIPGNEELDTRAFSTHKYNMLRKVNQPSIAALTQVHNRWENFLNHPAH